MKNIEVINSLNNINAFVNAQNKANKALLSVSGQFAIKANEKALMDVYKPYEATLNDIRDKYKEDEESEDYRKELKELLELEVDVNLRKVHEEDYKDGVTINDIALLDFMTE